MRIAAVADLHCTIQDRDRVREGIATLAQDADLLILAGDLTDEGKPEQMEVLIGQLARIPIPVVAVLGNHDYESNRAEELQRLMRGAGIRVLDGEAYEHAGVGFAGVKGFCGGFGRGELTAFGEREIKAFVHAATEEALRLERAMARLRQERRVVVTHYAPIAETVRGEPAEIYPFLGSSRLGDVCDRYGASVVVHGHAHHGAAEGHTRGGIPVYNVALPLLQLQTPPAVFRMLEV